MKTRAKQFLESITWFSGAGPEMAMKADEIIRQHAHSLLSQLIIDFPELPQDGLTTAVGKAEKALASAIADLLSPEPETPEEEPLPTDMGDLEDDETSPEEEPLPFPGTED